MKLLIILVFFVGIIMIMNGIYEERIKQAEKKVKVVYKFIPRSYFDEQIFSSQFESKFSNIFDDGEELLWSANQRIFDPTSDKKIKNSNNDN